MTGRLSSVNKEGKPEQQKGKEDMIHKPPCQVYTEFDTFTTFIRIS